MEHEQDFSALRSLLALKKLEMPLDTEVNRFLIELHRRQRVQLLAPTSRWSKISAWVEEKVSALSWGPSLSYGSAFAALALVAITGLGQQVQVTPSAGGAGTYNLSFHMPTSNATLALLPGSFGTAALAPAKTTDAGFTAGRPDSTTTRFVLGGTQVASYDANVAF